MRTRSIRAMYCIKTGIWGCRNEANYPGSYTHLDVYKRQVQKSAGVDKQHNGVSGYGTVLESYIAKAAVEDINAEPGDWVAAVEVTDETTWNEIVKGDITGFSIGGTATLKQEGEEHA